ncbi:MAG: TRAP transporter large permease subunit [Hyphomicrobiales bacterium]|nr:TRAP transporter large permease subunit [Hyphomicrobiales bacterium]
MKSESAASADVPVGAVRSILARIDSVLGRAVEIPVALLTAVEIVILFAGVVARYGFRRPFTWSDELASILFLWLAMLGTVVAFRRMEHMRMAMLVTRAGPRLRAFLEALAVATTIAFLVLILGPAIEHAADEAMVVTPALEIPSVWRAAALPVGCGLMLLFAALRLARVGGFLDVVLALGLIVAIGAALWLLKPVLMAIGNYKLLVFFVFLVGAGVLAGAPIAFVFALATFAFLAITTRTPLSVVVSRIDEGMSHIILLAVPLFVFLGLLIEATGMAKAMVDFLSALLGHLRGGLSYVLLGAMYLVSGISGSKAADMAAVAPVLFPEMKARGARPGDLVALLSTSGAMSETIPPSLVLITIGSVTGVSIAALFTGGLLPALVLALALCGVVWRRYRNDDLSHVRRAPATEILKTFELALPGLALPFLIRAAVVEGVATATEVSTIGIVYTFVVGLVLLGKFPWGRLMPMLIDTASLCGAILFIIGAATAMAWALTQSGFSRDLAAAMTGLPGGGATFLVVSIVAFIVLGSVLEGIPAIVLFGPLLFPIARQVGINEVHYAMVVVLAMGIGLFAPPFGVGYYAACAIGRVSPDEGVRPIWGYLVALLVGLAIVAAVPWLSIGFLGK